MTGLWRRIANEAYPATLACFAASALAWAFPEAAGWAISIVAGLAATLNGCWWIYLATHAPRRAEIASEVTYT